PARHLQVEQDRAPAALPDQPGLARPPLTSYDVIIATIGAVTTTTGLTVRAVLDENSYPAGLKISGEQIKDIEDRCLARHDFHGEWNYALLPVPRPAPDPQPDPEPAAPPRPGPARPGRPR